MREKKKRKTGWQELTTAFKALLAEDARAAYR
jgi:hypothetical protein